MVSRGGLVSKNETLLHSLYEEIYTEPMIQHVQEVNQQKTSSDNPGQQPRPDRNLKRDTEEKHGGVSPCV